MNVGTAYDISRLFKEMPRFIRCNKRYQDTYSEIFAPVHSHEQLLCHCKALTQDFRLGSA